jgi:hypothetical protein
MASAEHSPNAHHLPQSSRGNRNRSTCGHPLRNRSRWTVLTRDENARSAFGPSRTIRGDCSLSQNCENDSRRHRNRIKYQDSRDSLESRRDPCLQCATFAGSGNLLAHVRLRMARCRSRCLSAVPLARRKPHCLSAVQRPDSSSALGKTPFSRRHRSITQNRSLLSWLMGKQLAPRSRPLLGRWTRHCFLRIELGSRIERNQHQELAIDLDHPAGTDVGGDRCSCLFEIRWLCQSPVALPCCVVNDLDDCFRHRSLEFAISLAVGAGCQGLEADALGHPLSADSDFGRLDLSLAPCLSLQTARGRDVAVCSTGCDPLSTIRSPSSRIEGKLTQSSRISGGLHRVFLISSRSTWTIVSKSSP